MLLCARHVTIISQGGFLRYTTQAIARRALNGGKRAAGSAEAEARSARRLRLDAHKGGSGAEEAAEDVVMVEEEDAEAE